MALEVTETQAIMPPEQGRMEAAPAARRGNYLINDAQCRILYDGDDEWVGKSFELYGEYAYLEEEVFARTLGPGRFAVEVGAHIGAHTLLMARRVLPGGTVLAFEPHRLDFQRLCANVALNQLENVYCYQEIIGAEDGPIPLPETIVRPQSTGSASREERKVVALDALELPACDFLRVAGRNRHLSVLQSGRRTIAACRPVIYLVDVFSDDEPRLQALLTEWRYDTLPHVVPLFRQDNRRGNANNVFPGLGENNWLCVPVTADNAG